MFYDKQLDRIHIEGTFEGASVFLFGGGRSITPRHIELGHSEGIVTAAINEGGHYIRPNIYMSTSGITMPKSLLQDPTVMKFTRVDRMSKPIYEDRKRRKPIYEYPNTFGFHLSQGKYDEDWDSTEFIYSQEEYGDFIRNSAITMINLLYKLGFKKIYLVGMDFYGPTEKCTYFYEREYINEGINDALIAKVKKTLKQLVKNSGVKIYNTNPKSKLNFFPYIEFEKAISQNVVRYEPDIYDTFSTERLVWGWNEYMGINKSHLLKK